MIALRLTLLLLILAAPLHADADADYAALLEAFNNKAYAAALTKAEAFAAANPGHRHVAAALYMGGNAGMHARENDRAAAMHEALLAAHPDNRHTSKARDELVTIYDAARKLDACIARCEANLKAEPKSTLRDRWTYMIGQSRFRQWKFKQAEADFKAFKEAFADSLFVAWADYYLERVNPPVKVNEHGVRDGYTGKFAGDVRLQAALERLPQDFAHARESLKRTLGVDIGRPRVVFELQDKGFSRDTTRAYAETIAIDYEPHTLLTFYTEHIVVSDYDHRSRVVHELKHAGFRDLMGVAYLDLPVWVREGLAVYGAEQFEDRAAAILGSEVFAGRDPRGILKGIDNTDHGVTDYLEDAAAFLWLEAKREGAVHEFCRRILKGESYVAVYAELADMPLEDALKAAAQHARELVDARLGKAEAAFIALREADFAARRASSLSTWAKTGVARYREWLESNPAHPCTANARIRLGQVLILTGQHEAGREQMGLILQHEHARSTLCDDAQFWLARSFELAGDKDAATAAWGVLLRDYSWCRAAIERKDTPKAAGPEVAKDNDG